MEVVKALKAESGRAYTGAFRMADFADIAVKIGRYSGIESEIKGILAKLKREQLRFALEGDPVVSLLQVWVIKNSETEVENKQLCEELSELASQLRMEFPYRGKHRAFAQRMNILRQSSLPELFTVTERAIGGNRKVYSYKLREEPQ
jgi:hypothetical protein